MSGTTATIPVTISNTFVAPRRETRSVVYIIEVKDDSTGVASGTLKLTVNKKDNGMPQLRIRVSPTQLRITPTTDPDGVGRFRYRLQSRDEGDSRWRTISDARRSNANPYTVTPPTGESTLRYRANVDHADGQKYKTNQLIGPFPIDVDGDNDGLIDVYYLEDLDAIRNQPDGSGYGLAAVDTITAGCPDSGCTGYELLRDLDFTTEQSYVDATAQVQGQTTTLLDDWTVDNPAVASDTGWLPIASVDVPFTSLFNGNNNNISNLQINRDTVDDASIGLFAALSSEARLENVGILDVAIEGRGYVGSLVGQNKGTIVNSYVQGGEVTGTQHSLGGLVAINASSATSVIINSYASVITISTEVLSPGGLVGRNRGVIINSYAAGDVSGPCDVGGLVAESFVGSQIVNSYAAGDVRRTGNCMDDETLNRAGGLVGFHRGLIRNSYASGRVTGNGSIGGLVGDAENGTVEFSYWDSTVNNDITADDEDGIAASTSVLRTTQSAMGIYAEWSSDDWDFGTEMQYPLLRYTSPTDIAIAPVCDDDLDTVLPRCGSLLLAQTQSGLSDLLFFVDDDAMALDMPFSLSVLNYTVNVENTNTIELLPYGINPQNESIAIRRVGDPDTDYSEGSGERSLPIPIPAGESTLEIVVGTMSPVTYSITVTNTVDPIMVQEIIAPDTVSEGDPINLSATVIGGAIISNMYQWTSDPAAFLAEQDRTAATLSFTVPIVFVSRDDASRDVEITLTVGDDFTSSSATRTVTVVKVDNGQLSFTETVTVSSISIAVVPGSDLDGDGTIDSYTWQRRSVGDTEWTTITDQTSAMFSVPPQDNGGTLYRVQVMSTDAQDNRFTSLLGPYRPDIDDNDNGLIDIYYLEDLDAVRHQTDGRGYGITDITRGCPSEGCRGYELRRDLDFASTPSYVNVAMNRAAWTVDKFNNNVSVDPGWRPIGSVSNFGTRDCNTSLSNCFRSIFEGNGFSISNLQINRDGTDEIGLFAGTRNTGTIRNLGLREVEVEGRERVGGIVGRNEGNLINTHVVEGSVRATVNNIGLLVGVNFRLIINSYVRGTVTTTGRWVGGICGFNNRGRIINSYANAMVTGEANAGGLAAENLGTISNSYAMGSVRITESVRTDRVVGGLISGLFGSGSRVSNSYSTAVVSSAATNNEGTGGLIGTRGSPDLMVSSSYWDRTVNTEVTTAANLDGTSQTTVELQMPTNENAATGIYADWSTDDWDFGTPRQYPALLYNEVAGVDACDADAATPLPRCGSLLPGQRSTTPTITTDGSLEITLVEDTFTTRNIVVAGDVLSVTVDSSNDAVATAMVSGAGGTRVLEIRGVGVGDATITVTVDNGRGRTNSTASLVFNVSVSANPAPMITLTPSTAQSLPLGAMRTIMVSVADSNYGEGDRVTLTTMSSDPTIVSVVPPTVTGINNNTPRTLTLNALQGGMATITFTAEDSGGLVGNIVELSVRVNTTPTLSNIPTQPVRLLAGVNTSIDVTLDDADADDMPANFMVRATSDTPGVAGVSVSGSGATRTLEIVGVGAGDATITVTVDDNRDVANSVFSESFTVQVEANTAPTITLAPSADQTLPLGAMPTIMVSVADSNYGFGDTVTLTAMSSDPTIVSVAPPTVTGINNNTSSTFTLNAMQGGVATITFTAEDSGGLVGNIVELSVRVNTTPTLSNIPTQPVRLLAGMNTSIDVTLGDADADDTPTIEVASDDTQIATVSESGSGATRTLEIVGVGAGDATITVTVNDNRGAANSVFSESFTVQVEGTVAPMLEIVSAPEQPIQLGNTTQVVVSVSDSNFDSGDRIILTAVSSSATIVSVMPGQIDNIGSDSRETLTLTANRAGTAEITVTATDLDDLSTSRTMTVIVNTPPTLSAQVPNRVDAMVDVRFERDISEFFSDADSDTLTYGIAIEPPSSLIDTFSTQTGVWTFTATDADASQSTAGSIVTVSADDGRGGRVQASFTLVIDAPLTGTVRIAPDSDNRWQLRAISMFADANGIATTSHEWFRVTNGRAMRVGTDENYTIPESNVARAAGTSYRLVVTVVDNIEQSSTLTATYTVANIAPMITQVNVVPSTTTEGRTVRMTATASDENFDGLNYSWRVRGINADATDVSGETAPLTIRDYFVTDATAATATAIFMVAVSDGTITTIGRFSVLVNKEDNGVVSVDNLTRSSTTETRLIFSGIDETSETDGGISGAVTYHWQQCLGSLGNDCLIDAGVGSGWEDIAGESDIVGDDAIFYEVPDMLSAPPNHRVRSGDRFRVRIAYTDLQGYTRNVYSSNLGARLGQNTTPTISVDDAQATDITLLEGGRITVPVSVDDSDGGALNVTVVSADEAIASATISGDGATRTLEISGEGAGETMITATVDDGTGEANSAASLVFNVAVVENTAPTIMITPSSAQTLAPNSTAHIVVSVMDDNFNLDDVVTLTAVSSTPSVVSVMPQRSADITDITTDTSITFELNALRGGISMIRFIATDRGGLPARAELSVRVNTAPTISGIPSAPVRLLGGASRTLQLTLDDADTDDTLAIRIDTDDSMIATATIIATSGAMRTLEVRGVGAGNTTITVVVNDGRGVANSQVSEQFAVQVEISEAPTIDIVSAPQQAIVPDGTADIVVRVSDANFDFGDRVALTAESSSRTVVSVMPQRIDAIGSNMRETLTLSANKAGVAEIILTATDNEGLRSSETVVVTVNTPPTLSDIPDQPIRLLEGLGTEFDIVINDADAGDSPSVRIDTSDSMIASATISGDGTTRTLAVRSVGAGNAMITVTVDDGRDVTNSEVSERFAVQVEANVAPVIMITQPSTTQIVVSVADANFNLSDRVTLDAMSSSATIVSVTPAQETDITTDTMITFTLSIEQDGEATITFIATDRGGLSNRVTVSVNDTDAAIRIRVKVFLEGPLQ